MDQRAAIAKSPLILAFGFASRAFGVAMALSTWLALCSVEYDMMANQKTLGVQELEDHFARITVLMYDTSVPVQVLEKKVYPHLAPNIEFVDPWILARGRGKFETGLRGFHCVIRFNFGISQLNVHMNEKGDGGRVLVDGVMNLKQLVVYTYPLRTLLAYDFVMTQGGESFEITRLEEMWSYADMIQNVPLLGRLYDASRVVGGYFFTGLFWLSCAVKERVLLKRT